MSLCNIRVRSDSFMLRAGWRAIVALATLFSVGCAGTKMASTPPSTSTSAGTLSPSSATLSFGNVQVGGTKSMSLSLTNTATQSATVQVSQVTASGQGFTATGVTLPVTLTAGQSITFNVNFKPASAGAASGSLSIVSSASDSNVSVALSGNGLASGQLAVSPSTMSFSSVTVGSSQQQSGTLTAGSSNVTVSSASWNGTGFSLSGITFPVTITAGQNLPFTVTFAPQVAGTVNGGVSFVSNASNSPTAEVLSGTGVQTTQHSVALTWNADTSTVQGYYVYRGGQSGGPYTKISALQPGTSYTDTAVTSGLTYYYVVTALGTNSLESGYSNQAAATIP